MKEEGCSYQAVDRSTTWTRSVLEPRGHVLGLGGDETWLGSELEISPVIELQLHGVFSCTLFHVPVSFEGSSSEVHISVTVFNEVTNKPFIKPNLLTQVRTSPWSSETRVGGTPVSSSRLTC